MGQSLSREEPRLSGRGDSHWKRPTHALPFCAFCNRVVAVWGSQTKRFNSTPIGGAPALGSRDTAWFASVGLRSRTLPGT